MNALALPPLFKSGALYRAQDLFHLFTSVLNAACMHTDDSVSTHAGLYLRLPARHPGRDEPLPAYCIPPAAARLSLPYSAIIDAQPVQHAPQLPVRENIIHLLDGAPEGITMAQRSNFAPPTAWMYEDLWRKKSIGLLSGQDFSFDDERALLTDWLAPAAGEQLLDIGCSSGFYARSLHSAAPQAIVTALDFSLPMLKDARKRARAENRELYLLRADAQALPFAAQQLDGLSCGGSLNEFAQPERALREARRVMKPGGRFFMMHLLEAQTSAGRLLQQAAGGGGIHFWSAEASRALFEESGFRIRREKQLGIVMFSLLEPA